VRQKSLLLISGIALFLAAIVPASVTAQATASPRTGRFTLGLEAGAQFATADSTALGLAFSGDYFFNQNLSIGPLLQVGVTDDLFQFGQTAQLKYTYDIDRRLKTNLQGGAGFIYSRYTKGPNRHDMSFLIPVGPGLEYNLSDDFSIGTTLLFNFNDLSKVKNENFFVSLLGGLKVRF
jgi:outer membrane protein with beta-barrel domain